MRTDFDCLPASRLERPAGCRQIVEIELSPRWPESHTDGSSQHGW